MADAAVQRFPIFVPMAQTIEWISVSFGVLYLLLLIRRSVWAWPSGIIGSALSILLFIQTQLYSEAILFSFYVVIGFYGWYMWYRSPRENGGVVILRWRAKEHAIGVLIGVLVALGLGRFFETRSDAARPYADAFTTSFAFVASYMEARRVLSGWLYWIALNGFSIWLYADRGLKLYAGLMVIYTILSVYGYWSWLRDYRRQSGLRDSAGTNPEVLDTPLD